MNRTRMTSAGLLTGLVLVGTGLACKKPEAAQPTQKPAPTPAASAPAPKVDDGAERRHQAELEAARKAEEAKRIAAEKLAKFRKDAAEALQDVHFDYDKADIKSEDRARLLKIADFLKAYPEARVEIQGHCDERGTNEYNLALGNRRAAMTLQFLKALGAKDLQFTTISYGKERPMCTERTEACMAKNRRAHFELK